MSQYKELPERPQSKDSEDEIKARLHSAGFRLEQSYYNFLDAMSDLLMRPRTEQEDAQTALVYREAATAQEEELSNKVERLLEEVRERGLEVKKVRSGHETDNIFVLSSSPVDITVDQGEKRTALLFLPNKSISLEPRFIYPLFSEELPEALYEEDGPLPPNPRDIIKNTVVYVTPHTGVSVPFQLGSPAKKEEFEEVLNEHPDQIDLMRMEVSTDTGISYALTLPNMQNTKSKYVQFSFPSRDKFSERTMGVLLKLHEKAEILNGDERAYAKTFADGITDIKDTLRVR